MQEEEILTNLNGLNDLMSNKYTKEEIEKIIFGEPVKCMPKINLPTEPFEVKIQNNEQYIEKGDIIDCPCERVLLSYHELGQSCLVEK